MFQLKRYSAILLLLLFLFPQVDKGLHEWEHSKDTHCDVKELHFCKTEHVCDICDFISSIAHLDVDPGQNSIRLSASDYSFSIYTSGHLGQSPLTTFLRGPPQLRS